MIRVRVEGLPSLFLQGHLIGEDDRYIYLQQEGSSKTMRIPQARVIYTEDFDTVSPAPTLKTVVEDASNSVQEPSPVIPQATSKDKLVREAAKKAKGRKKDQVREALASYFEKMKEPQSIMKSDAQSLSGLSQIDPPPPAPDYDPQDIVEVDVLFEGAKEGGFRIEVPKGAMTGRYTPTLGREIFSHQEPKNFLSGVILDGVPKVEDNKIIYTTKTAGETPSSKTSMQDKLKLAGAAAAVGTTFNKEKGTPISDKMPNTFSMTTSPFESLPTLSLNEEDSE